MYAICMLVFLALNTSRSFGAIRCTFQKLGVKTARRRVKRTKIWAPGVYVTCMLVFLTMNTGMSSSFGVILCTFPKIGP